MERIRQNQLEWLVERINEVTKSPPYPRSKDDNGKITTWIGNYHLDYAYGGVQLVRMVNENGGIETISHRCHVPKRELYNWMQAFLAGHSAK